MIFTLDLGRNYDFITSNVTPLSRFQDDKETYRREIKKIAAKNFEKTLPREISKRISDKK